MSVIHFFTSIASTFRHPTRLFISLFRFIPTIVVEVNHVMAAKGIRKLRCRCSSGSRNKRVSYHKPHWLLWTFNCWCDDMKAVESLLMKENPFNRLFEGYWKRNVSAMEFREAVNWRRAGRRCLSLERSAMLSWRNTTRLRWSRHRRKIRESL